MDAVVRFLKVFAAMAASMVILIAVSIGIIYGMFFALHFLYNILGIYAVFGFLFLMVAAFFAWVWVMLNPKEER